MATARGFGLWFGGLLSQCAYRKARAQAFGGTGGLNTHRPLTLGHPRRVRRRRGAPIDPPPPPHRHTGALVAGLVFVVFVVGLLGGFVAWLVYEISEVLAPAAASSTEPPFAERPIDASGAAAEVRLPAEAAPPAPSAPAPGTPVEQRGIAEDPAGLPRRPVP